MLQGTLSKFMMLYYPHVKQIRFQHSSEQKLMEQLHQTHEVFTVVFIIANRRHFKKQAAIV
jgi:hypothetical protein